MAKSDLELFTDDGLIAGIQDIPKGRWTLRCVLCKEKTGAKLQCHFGQCGRSMHPQCARREKLPTPMLSTEKGILCVAYCKKHAFRFYERIGLQPATPTAHKAQQIASAKGRAGGVALELPLVSLSMVFSFFLTSAIQKRLLRPSLKTAQLPNINRASFLAGQQKRSLDRPSVVDLHWLSLLKMTIIKLTRATWTLCVGLLRD